MRAPNTKGISPRALKQIGSDHHFPQFYSTLRRLKPRRQEQIADLMAMSADRRLSFLTLLVSASKQSDFVGRKKRTRGISRRQLTEIEETMRRLEAQFRSSAPAYRENANALVVTEAYLRRILQNVQIANYIKSVHREIFDQFAADGLVSQKRLSTG
jgi:hypothetical protein